MYAAFPVWCHGVDFAAFLIRNGALGPHRDTLRLMPRDTNHSAHVICSLNHKGGTGKSMAVYLLAGAGQESRQRVLVIDCDTQANISGTFLDDADDRPGVEQLFNPAADHDVLPLVRRTVFEHIDILPSSARLTPFDLADRSQWEQTDAQFALVEPIRELRSRYDYILIDCPPRLSVVSYAALTAADGCICALEAADWGAQGLASVAGAIEEVQRRYNPSLRLTGYLVSRFKQSRAVQQAYFHELRKQFGPLAFDTVIPDRARFEASVVAKKPINLRAPSSEEAAIARRFFREVERRLAQGRAGHAIERGTHVRARRPVAA